MALDFPANPVDGQVYGSYTYSSSAGVWRGNAPSATVAIVSPTKPLTASQGDIWVNTTTGIAFVFYNDGNTSQWMELLSSAVPAVNEIMPYGTIVQTARTSAPAGWLLCQGQLISRATYAGLFAAIGTTYGSGDGSTTFGIPNLQGVVPVGKTASGTFAALGGTGGAETHTLTEAQIPSHTHIQNAHNHTQDSHGHVVSANSFAGDRQIAVGPLGGDGDKYSLSDSGNDASTTTANIYARGTTATNQSTIATNQSTGGGQAHNNLQPYIVLNYMIKV